jgi:hypothetical protein
MNNRQRLSGMIVLGVVVFSLTFIVAACGGSRDEVRDVVVQRVKFASFPLGFGKY